MPLIEIYRAKIDPANADRLLEIRTDAVAEFQQQVPELLQADLVWLEDGVWLDVLTGLGGQGVCCHGVVTGACRRR